MGLQAIAVAIAVTYYYSYCLRHHHRIYFYLIQGRSLRAQRYTNNESRSCLGFTSHQHCREILLPSWTQKTSKCLNYHWNFEDFNPICTVTRISSNSLIFYLSWFDLGWVGLDSIRYDSLWFDLKTIKETTYNVVNFFIFFLNWENITLFDEILIVR